MAYRKPGVEISQVQQSATPIFTDPDLRSAIVGPAYHVQPMTEVPNITYSGTSASFNFDAVNSDFSSVDNAGLGLVTVDLIGTKGSITGQVIHLEEGTDFTASDIQVVISGSLSEVPFGDEASVKVAYRTLKTNLNSYSVVESQGEIETKLGTPVSYNPLAFGCSLAMSNAGASIGYYGTADATSDKFTGAALDALELEEVYCIAPMTHHDVAGNYKTHCETQSSPANKKERIAIVNAEIPTTGNYHANGGAENKGDIAAAIRDGNSVHGSKRLVLTHPDMCYVEELRHISTLKQGWIQASFAGMGTYSTFSTYGFIARFTGTTTVGAKTYYAMDPITDAVWAEMIAANIDELTAYVPVPGWNYGAVVAGQSAGQVPEQPFTNLATVGISKTIGSQDYFSDENLNTMASGGTYIMTQSSASAPIISRHQMTTDITSVAKRELSITRAIDAAAKFVRKGVKPYIGKYNITPSFLKLLNSVIVGQGLYLVRTGVLNDFKLSSLKVDELSPDTILVDIQLLPKYPVNYIKIQLIF
ncbi:MAG: hypothetical protein H8E12_16975 [Rhodobacteraceae bacterium]|nr:hypothetical protein [Paracoccaceae bacterium]